MRADVELQLDRYKPLFNGAKRLCVARSAMAAKTNHGQEPSIPALRLACPAATMNPQTGKPFSDMGEKRFFFTCLATLMVEITLLSARGKNATAP